VVDTSVAAKWFFDEPGTTQALQLLEAFRSGRSQVLAPDLIYSEFANVVWKRVVLGSLSAEDGMDVVEAFEQLPVEATAARGLAASAYGFAVRFSITVYDAMFVTLSRLTTADLVTADVSLYRKVAHLGGVKLLEVDRG
jgi:predicted nucleic acid-binding protein